MSRHHLPDGELDLGILIMAAYGLDRGWTVRASCLEYAGTDKPTPWQVSKGYKERDAGGDVTARGTELITMALMVCATCEAQYDCARYAVKGAMCAGTWAMDIGDLHWMTVVITQDDALAVIDFAEAEGTPVQVAVTTARSAHPRRR